jgi:anti-sigma regulatory factor (Ser/Thr protein kinase)
MTGMKEPIRQATTLPNTLTLPARRQGLEQVMDWLDTVPAAQSEPELGARLQLVAEEVFLNIATHAYPAGGLDGEVRFTLLDTPEHLVLRVEDDGTPFDPLQDIDPPDLEAGLEDRPVGKLGVFLVRQSSDLQTYERVDGTNRLDVGFLKRGDGPQDDID